MGRPSLLTAERHALVVAAMRRAATHQTAAEYAGVTERTLWNWIRWGKRDHRKGLETAYAALFRELVRARADAKVDLLDGIMGAAKGALLEETIEVREHGEVRTETRKIRRAPPDTRAAIHMLRTMERGYSVADRVEVTGPDGSPLRISREQVAALPDADLDASIRVLASITEAATQDDADLDEPAAVDDEDGEE